MYLNIKAIIFLFLVFTIRRIQSAPFEKEDDIQSLVNLAIDQAAPPILETALKLGNDDLESGERFATSNFKRLAEHIAENGAAISAIQDSVSPYVPQLTSVVSDAFEGLQNQIKSIPFLNVESLLKSEVSPSLEATRKLLVSADKEYTNMDHKHDDRSSKSNPRSKSVVKKDLSLAPLMETSLLSEHPLILSPTTDANESVVHASNPEILSSHIGEETNLQSILETVETKTVPTPSIPVNNSTKLESFPGEERKSLQKLEDAVVSEIKVDLQEVSKRLPYSTSQPEPDTVSNPKQAKFETPNTAAVLRRVDAAIESKAQALKSFVEEINSQLGDSLTIKEVFIPKVDQTMTTINNKSGDTVALSRSPIINDKSIAIVDFDTSPVPTTTSTQKGINSSSQSQNQGASPLYFILRPCNVTNNSLLSYLERKNLLPISNIMLYLNISHEQNPKTVEEEILDNDHNLRLHT